MTGAELREWIKVRRLTQREAAEMFGLTRDHLNHILAGKYRVNRTLELLVEKLTAPSAPQRRGR